MSTDNLSARWSAAVAAAEPFWPALPGEVLALLTSTAYAAVQQGMVDEADTIATGVAPFELWYTDLAVMRATVAVAANRPAEGLALLEKLIAKRPHLHAAVCACAMLKKELGLANWRALAQRVADSPDADAESVRAARELLDLSPHAAQAPVRPAAAGAHALGLRFVR
jgi:hypothetical protein